MHSSNDMQLCKVCCKRRCLFKFAVLTWVGDVICSTLHTTVTLLDAVPLCQHGMQAETHLEAQIISLIYQQFDLLASLQYPLYVVHHDVLHLINLSVTHIVSCYQHKTKLKS